MRYVAAWTLGAVVVVAAHLALVVVVVSLLVTVIRILLSYLQWTLVSPTPTSRS